ncbi:MAG TPA: IS1182 family transposase, partial [Bacillota bacterium]
MGLSSQRHLFEPEQLLPEGFIPADSFYGVLAQWGERLLPRSLFDDLYKNRQTGRPEVDPAMLCKALLLQFYEDVSDREAEQRARYDLRWKHALGIPLDEARLDHVTLCRFRARLLTVDGGRRILERVLQLAVEAGLIRADAARVIDSTHVLGAGAVQDTYTLLRKALRKVVARVRDGRPDLWEQIKPLLQRSEDYERQDDRKPDIDWSDPDARQTLLNEFVADARRVLEALGGQDLSAELRDAVALLADVTDQDIEEQADGRVRIRQGVAKDRVISVTDPEMRHGHKSSQGRFDGYKAEVAADPDSELITSVAVVPGNAPDAAAVGRMLDQEAASGLHASEWIGDTAYGGGELRAELAARKIELVAPTSPVPSRNGLYPKTDFTIDLDAETCRCPAGHLAEKVYRRNDGSLRAFQFAAALCSQCPLQPQCTRTPARGRIVTVHRRERLLQQARAFEQTEAFKRRYRQRPKIERKLAEM